MSYDSPYGTDEIFVSPEDFWGEETHNIMETRVVNDVQQQPLRARGKKIIQNDKEKFLSKPVFGQRCSCAGGLTYNDILLFVIFLIVINIMVKVQHIYEITSANALANYISSKPSN